MKFLANIDLTKTKQSLQIAHLKNRLEKTGWTILEEELREFEGIPRWEIADDIPNLIATWRVQRSIRSDPIKLDFIAWSDMDSYEIRTNDCAKCVVRNTATTLHFTRDRSLKNSANKGQWEKELSEFIERVNTLDEETLE